MNREDVPAELIELLHELDLYRYVDWQSYDKTSRQGPTKDLDYAACVSSLNRVTGEHVVALDIDVPAWLVPSSTPGHSHLYIDKPMPWPILHVLLDALAAAGVIERGYADASIAREATTLRLPWIKKGEEPIHPDSPDAGAPGTDKPPGFWEPLS